MNKFAIVLMLCVGCVPASKTVTKKYAVMSCFNEVMMETDDKAKAYEAAHFLTLQGRIFASRPYYFVKENK